MVNAMTDTKARATTGFTLVELMVTLAIVGILASLAAPSFRNLTASQRIRAAASDLSTALTLTRSEAIKRNSNVVLASNSGAPNWESGWTVTASGTTILTQGAFTGVTIDGASAVSVTYNRSGRVNTTNAASFDIADASAGSSVTGRCVTIGVTGQPTTSEGEC